MSSMPSLSDPSICPHLVGVIDLRDGLAVHAVAGRRDTYRPFSLGPDHQGPCNPGDPVHLARLYHDAGLRHLYLADLNAIIEGSRQVGVIERLLALGPAFEEILIDCGLTGWETKDCFRAAQGDSRVRWIVATESAGTLDAIPRLCEQLRPEQVLLGLDFRSGRPVCRVGDPDDWVDAALRCQIYGVLPLDVAAVGTRCGPRTGAVCGWLRGRSPTMKIYSGGGVRDAADVIGLRRSGCDKVLVATAIRGAAADPAPASNASRSPRD
jgi:phosphoribosylformimino-5-aminoimidazole carboxamide ribotide isomerase